MKYLLIAIGFIMLTACGSTPNRCNQKNAQSGYQETGSQEIISVRS